MTGNGQRLREEIRHVVEAADEEDTEVSLADPVCQDYTAYRVQGTQYSTRPRL